MKRYVDWAIAITCGLMLGYCLATPEVWAGEKKPEVLTSDSTFLGTYGVIVVDDKQRGVTCYVGVQEPQRLQAVSCVKTNQL